jgi:hypothetical protein
MSPADLKRTLVAHIAMRFGRGLEVCSRDAQQRVLFGPSNSQVFLRVTSKTRRLYGRCCSAEYCGVLALDLVRQLALDVRPLVRA